MDISNGNFPNKFVNSVFIYNSNERIFSEQCKNFFFFLQINKRKGKNLNMNKMRVIKII